MGSTQIAGGAAAAYSEMLQTMKRSARGVLLSSFSVLAFCLSHPALAQQATNDGETIDLDTVTVTATRADRPLSDVPQTVRVVERAEIEEQLQLTNSAAAVLAKLIPGYTLPTQTISSASETFRGRDLLVMIDGVPMNTPLRDVSRILPMIDLNTVERIEVVAGASSLYGSGATGGTVNFITRKPTDGKPTVAVNTAIRAFTAKPGESLAPEVSATVSGKATSGIDYLFSGSGTFANKTYDGDGRELPSDGMLGQGGGDRFGRGNFLGKVGYDFDASRRFEVSASWIYMEQDPQWMTLYQPPFARPDFGNAYTGESVLEDTKSVSARYTDSGFALGELSVLAYYNDIKKRFNYSEFDIGYNNMVYYSGNPASPTSRYNQSELYSERTGLNLTIDTALNFVEGAKLTWGSDVVYDKTWQTMTNGEDIFTPLQQTTYAAFAQLQVPIGERLVVRAGVRYEYLDLSVSDYTRPAAFMGGVIPPYGPVAAILPPLNVTGGDYNYSAPTFNIGATFKLTETSEIYGGFSQGFALPDLGAFTRRAGAQTTTDALAHSCGLMPYPLPGNVPAGVNPCNKSWTLSYDDLGIEAQIVNNYELGLRYGFGRFRGSLAGFVSTSDQGVNFVAATNSIKQQKEIIYGVEFTGEYAVNDQLSLGTNLGWREGKWDSDGDGDIDYYLPNNRISTPFRGTVYGDYVFKTGARFRLEGEFWSGRDEYDGTDSNPADGLTIYEIDSGATINAAISQPLGGGTLYVSVDNLLDADYANPTATATRNLPVNGWGRTVTLGFSKTF
jgi:iron complex outermembrane receptor protein